MSEKGKEPPGKIRGGEPKSKTWRLKMEFSTENLKPIAEQLAALVSEELHSEQEAKIRRVESEIRRQLQAVGRMALAMVLSQADGTPEQEIACECGGKLQYQRRRTAEVLSVFGWVSYKRS
jgi:hypothetical protein